MTRAISEMFARSRSTVLADAIGAAALVVILVGGLNLPSLI